MLVVELFLVLCIVIKYRIGQKPSVNSDLKLQINLWKTNPDSLSASVSLESVNWDPTTVLSQIIQKYKCCYYSTIQGDTSKTHSHHRATPGTLTYQQSVTAPHDAEAQARVAFGDVYGGLTAGDDGTGHRVRGGQSARGGRAT